MKILILGSTGNIGNALYHSCNRNDIDCVGVAHREFDFKNRDVLKKIICKHNPTTIINAVGVPSAKKCEDTPYEAFDLNSIAVLNLVKVCNEMDILLVQISTHALFDGTKKDFYTEDDIPNPLNVYGASKYIAEMFVRSILKKYYIIRIPTLFGEAHTSSYSTLGERFLDWILKGKEFRVADDKIESLSYNRDVAYGILKILCDKKPYGIYHVANDGKVSLYDFAWEMARALKKRAKIIRGKDKDFPSSFDTPLETPTKSIKLKPMRNWKEALEDYLQNL